LVMMALTSSPLPMPADDIVEVTVDVMGEPRERAAMRPPRRLIGAALENLSRVALDRLVKYERPLSGRSSKAGA
jgi:hypothetical protein